jgi:hypothetical protein
MAHGISLTECSECLETYSNPRQLPCIHTFCLKCVKNFSRDKLPGDQIPCPICRKEFTLPDNGVDSLPKNFFIEQLKDLTDQSNRHCEGCSCDVTDPALRKQAVMYCVDCQQRFCESCGKLHRRVKVCRGHKLIDNADMDNTGTTVGELKVTVCDKHPPETVKPYCLTCKETICMKCHAELHLSHKCSDVNKVLDDLRQQMTVDIENITVVIKQYHDALKEQEKNKDDFSNTVEEVEKEICERAEQLKRMIDSEKQKLLQDVASRKTDRAKQIQQAFKNTQQRAAWIENLIIYIEEIRDKGTATDVAQQSKILHNRAEELLKTDNCREVNDLGSVSVSLEAVESSPNISLETSDGCTTKATSFVYVT